LIIVFTWIILLQVLQQICGEQQAVGISMYKVGAAMEALQHEFEPLLPILQQALPIPPPHAAYAQRWLMAHGLKWEGSSSSSVDDSPNDDARPYLAAHWRRGDRAFSVEMGFGGRLQTMINRPKRFAAFVKQQALLHDVRSRQLILSFRLLELLAFVAHDLTALFFRCFFLC
jgi:hypothetical protein